MYVGSWNPELAHETGCSGCHEALLKANEVLMPELMAARWY
jgi:coenzyme F420-reducing hydrogenase gamma subunit